MKLFLISFKNSLIFKCILNVICIALLIFSVSSCTPKVETFKTVEIKGAKEVYNASKTPVVCVSDSINPAVIMGSKGDVISFDEYVLIPDFDRSDEEFIIETDDSAVYVNGKIYYISIPKDDKMISWFKEIGKRDLSDLRFISVGSTVPKSYLPYLEEIAKAKQGTGIFCDGNISEMSDLFKMFNPKYIIGPDINSGDYDLLAKSTDLEILWVTISDSVISEPFPAMPKLKQLIVSFEQKYDRIITNDIFTNNRQLEKLNLQIAGPLDLKVLSPLVNLKELTIGFADTLKNLDEINRLKKLEVLSITGAGKIYDPANIVLPDLRWMTFDPGFTQDEFNSFVIHHPKLEMVELVNTEDIMDYSALLKFPQLAGLSITDTVLDITTVEALKNLKYLSLPVDYLDNSAKRENLQKALPEARITANKGYLCLGSGWLLLLIPFVVVFRLLLRKKSVNHSW